MIDFSLVWVSNTLALCSFQGIPRNMTGIATKMRAAGYATHMAGKWCEATCSLGSSSGR